jgi:hypothetical protein
MSFDSRPIGRVEGPYLDSGNAARFVGGRVALPTRRPCRSRTFTSDMAPRSHASDDGSEGEASRAINRRQRTPRTRDSHKLDQIWLVPPLQSYTCCHAPFAVL